MCIVTFSYFTSFLRSPCFDPSALIIYGNNTDYSTAFRDAGDDEILVDSETYMLQRTNGSFVVTFASGNRDVIVMIMAVPTSLVQRVMIIVVNIVTTTTKTTTVMMMKVMVMVKIVFTIVMRVNVMTMKVMAIKRQ